MEDITDDKLKAIAELILQYQVDDVEYLTIWEITMDQLGVDPDDVDEQIVRRVDELVASAVVTIEFPDKEGK